jgi:hypothetical protein
MELDLGMIMLGLGMFSAMLITSAVRLVISYFSVHSHSKHALELDIDGKIISIDLSSIDKENPRKIDNAIAAIGLARRAVD